MLVRFHVYIYCFFFFFKQKTAYEMRISDWSSDVCSSDLFLDAQSFDGKVVGGVVDLAAAAGTALVAIAGDVYDEVGDRIEAVSLVDRFGEERARSDVLACIEEVVAEQLARLSGPTSGSDGVR